MKSLLRRLQPQLSARWLISIDAAGQARAWEFRADKLGRIGLAPLSHMPSGIAVVTLDPQHPYRRHLQCFPATATAGRAMLTGAGDEFPFPPEQLHYAFSLSGDQTYLCALEKQKLQQLLPEGIEPQAVLIAASGEEAQLEALRHYRRHGFLLDLTGNTRRILDRQRLQFFSRLLGIVGAVALVLLLLLNPSWPAYLLQGRIERLQVELEPLQQQRGIIDRMAVAQQAIALRHGQVEAKFPILLQNALDTLPPAHAITRIELREGMLVLGGNGPDPQPWLLALGIPKTHITIETAGNYNHFRVELPLAQWPVPAASQTQ